MGHMRPLKKDAQPNGQEGGWRIRMNSDIRKAFARNPSVQAFRAFNKRYFCPNFCILFPESIYLDKVDERPRGGEGLLNTDKCQTKGKRV